MSQSISAVCGDVLLLAGTRKGGFALTGGPERKEWRLTGPFLQGSEIFHFIYDRRSGGSLVAAENQLIWGAKIQLSHDLGQTWAVPSEPPRITTREDASINNVWHVEQGRLGEPGVLYAGVDPAALFKSGDGGDTWSEVTGLSNHPSRDSWEPGLGGLCLHSVIVDPMDSARMCVAISAVGVFETTDSGVSWEPRNRGMRADFLPERFPEIGQCPHKVLAHPARPGRLYAQTHCGVYRSDSLADGWTDITEGLPSQFGFPLGLHPHDPDTVFVIPEDEVLGQDIGGGLRYVTGAQFRIYRTRNGGSDWEPLTHGLPQTNAYLHVLRENMATDTLDPCGIYVGTTNGQLFCSRDEGDSWELMVDNLPPILSLEAVVLE